MVIDGLTLLFLDSLVTPEETLRETLRERLGVRQQTKRYIDIQTVERQTEDEEVDGQVA